jgi:hypothetical protein
MIAEIKCGKCDIIFPIKKDDYLKRITIKENPFLTRIMCPSCWAEMPYELKRMFDEFLFNNGKHDGWEVGMKFYDKDNRV